MPNFALRASFPALATLLLWLLVQALEQGMRVGSLLTIDVSAGRFSTAIVVNTMFLCCLPFIGATGASLTKLLGQSRKMAVESVMSPVAVICAMLLSLLVADLVTTRANVSSLAYSSGILVGWVLLPAGALLLGCHAGWKLTPDRLWYVRSL